LRQKAILNALEYYPFRGLIAILRILPYRLSKIIVVGLFSFFGYRIGIRKKVAYTQLKKVYPQYSEAKLKAIIKGVYQQMALSILEEYVLDDQKLLQKSSIKGQENIDHALSFGRGVILATAHFGNWEAARILPLKGLNMSAIAKKQRNTLFDNYTNSIRERNGLHIIDMKHGLRDIITDLKQNRIVALLADQNAGSKGMILDFMGYPASHWKGVAKLSLRYKIPILPAFVVRDKNDNLVFEFSPIIYEPDLEDKEENYPAILAQIIRVTEKYINQYPEHWFWVHKRWKHAYDMFEDID